MKIGINLLANSSLKRVGLNNGNYCDCINITYDKVPCLDSQSCPSHDVSIFCSFRQHGIFKNITKIQRNVQQCTLITKKIIFAASIKISIISRENREKRIGRLFKGKFFDLCFAMTSLLASASQITISIIYYYDILRSSSLPHCWPGQRGNSVCPNLGLSRGNWEF